MTTMNLKTKADARREIEEALADGGSYTILIVSHVLKTVGLRWGYKAANGLIAQYHLKERYGLHKRREDIIPRRKP